MKLNKKNEPPNREGERIADPMPGDLGISLNDNISAYEQILRVPRNKDVIIRRFSAGGFTAAVICIDGMCDTTSMNENILKPAMLQYEKDSCPVAMRTQWLVESVVSFVPANIITSREEGLKAIVDGQTLLLSEGCASGAVLDTRGFEKRNVESTKNEQVVVGPHESFVENLRTNITLVRRIIHSPRLVTEFKTLGTGVPTNCAVLYMDGIAQAEVVNEVKRRIDGISMDYVQGSGVLEQLIEDHPYALLPQTISTERPDRTASFLMDGQIVVLVDGSPYSLTMPVTLFHLIHSSDDTFMRWQYGSFLRIVRILGILIHIFLPGLYVAMLRFHPSLLSLVMLTSVYESRARIPLPIYIEGLLMTFAFYLINEASTRAPSPLGSALGIVSGLILGQAAVAADIVSPLLLIVVAASGLGGFASPNYSMSFGMRIAQLVVLTVGAFFGGYGIVIVLFIALCMMCNLTSLGSPIVAPLAPKRPANQGLLLRMPIWFNKTRSFFAAPGAMRRVRGTVRTWETKGEQDDS